MCVCLCKVSIVCLYSSCCLCLTLDEADTDLETDRLLGQLRTDDIGFYEPQTVSISIGNTEFSIFLQLCFFFFLWVWSIYAPLLVCSYFPYRKGGVNLQNLELSCLLLLNLPHLFQKMVDAQLLLLFCLNRNYHLRHTILFQLCLFCPHPLTYHHNPVFLLLPTLFHLI